MTRITPSPGWSAHLKTGHTGWLFFRSSRGSIICVKIPGSLTCCVAFTARIEDRGSKIVITQIFACCANQLFVFVAERRFEPRPALKRRPRLKPSLRDEDETPFHKIWKKITYRNLPSSILDLLSSIFFYSYLSASIGSSLDALNAG